MYELIFPYNNDITIITFVKYNKSKLERSIICDYYFLWKHYFCFCRTCTFEGIESFAIIDNIRNRSLLRRDNSLSKVDSNKRS